METFNLQSDVGLLPTELEGVNKSVDCILYCPKCKKIPKIELKEKDMIEISCTCFKKEDSIIDTEGEKSMKELMEYKTYTIPLERYMTEMKKESEKEKPNCCKTDKHNQKSAEYFCTECKQWYCEECLNEHNENSKDHHPIKSNGFEISSLCENDNCQNKGPIKYFCKDCGIHLCAECKKDHNSSHNIRKVKDVLSEKEKKKIYKEISEVSKEIEEKDDKEISEFFDGKEFSKENFLNFYKALEKTNMLSSSTLNYNANHNLKNNRIKDTLLYKSLIQKGIVRKYYIIGICRCLRSNRQK